MRRLIRATTLTATTFALLATVPTSPSSAFEAWVTARGGVKVRVAPASRATLQCLIDRIEAAGCRVRFMRGIGRGTVRHSLHPSGHAIDINQLARNRVAICPSPRLSRVAARSCGAISGGDWHRSPDNGHFQNGGWNGRRMLARRKPTSHEAKVTTTPLYAY